MALLRMKTLFATVLLVTLVCTRLSQAALTIKAGSFSVTGPPDYILKLSEGTEITFDITFSNDATQAEDVTDLHLYLSDSDDLSTTKKSQVASKTDISDITFDVSVPAVGAGGEKEESGKATITIPKTGYCAELKKLCAQIKPGDDSQCIDIDGKTNCDGDTTVSPTTEKGQTVGQTKTSSPESKPPKQTEASATTSEPNAGVHCVLSWTLILVVITINVMAFIM